MLKKIVNSTTHKGDRDMNLKDSPLKLVFASIVCCLLAAFALTGCGGSNNPSGPAITTSAIAPAGAAATATGTITITGILIDASTNNMITSTEPDIYVTLSLVGTSYSRSIQATSKAYAFTDLPIGYYSIVAEDKNGKFDKTTTFKSLSTSESINIRMMPSISNVIAPSLNFYGKVIDASFRSPNMFATVKAISNSGVQIEATTLYDGTFSFLGISSGTYTITFTSESFETTTRELVINDRIRFGTAEISVTNITAFTDGSNTARSGYNLGDVVLAPKIMPTGSIAGILYKADGTPLANTKLELVYDNDVGDQIPPGSILPTTFETNSLGYFLAINLPAGWYVVAYPGYEANLTPIIDNGSIKGYNFGAGDLVTKVWMDVQVGL
ncbi:MAG: carboxypeptidase regulatory-like domain-containing protein, partial [Erysipelotrichia bacterium]|nr:carboxypeptidase regulatory-like domain-containing protein [Erysipelotrichia bacterium]